MFAWERYLMERFIASFFENEKIEYFASTAISAEYVGIPRKLPQYAKFVTVFLIPYKTDVSDRNVSFYAVPRDYHFYIKELRERFAEKMRLCGIDEKADFFADNSPFFERKLACDLGLGFVGKNGLIINEKYGSYVFIAEIVTERKIDLSCGKKTERKECLGCGKCIFACPSQCLGGKDLTASCMSELTQKKRLSPDEAELVKNHYLVWGCDVCQEVCPHNANAKSSPIGFFNEKLVAHLTKNAVSSMNDEAFAERAFSWRGREVILRNIELSDIL